MAHAEDPELIKVWVRVPPRPGWLPYETEGLWASAVGADRARIANVPFIVDGMAQDDIVRFVTVDDGMRWVVERVEPSGNCAVRVLPVPTGPLGPSASAVHAKFAPFGIGGEAFSETLPLVAFSVPADADLAGIKALLLEGEEAGWWHFEVSCLSDSWNAARRHS